MTKIREGYKYTEIGVIPEDWEVGVIVTVCNILDSKRKPIKSSDRENMKGNIPYYGASGVIDYVKDYIFNEDLILLGEDGENLRSRNSPLAFKVTGKCWVNNHAHVLGIKDKSRDNIDFVTYALEKNDYTSIVVGSAQPKITQQDLRKIQIARPIFSEQQRIAEILSTTDAHIEKLDKIIEDYQLLKKGMMRKLLTEGIGHTEFKETEIGRIPKEWEVYKIKDICNIGRGRVISKKEIEAKPGIYPVYSSQTTNDGCMGYLNSYDFEGEYVTWTTDGVNAGSTFYRSGKFNCTNVCGTLKLKDSRLVSHKFLGLILDGFTDKYVVRNGNPKLMNNIMGLISIPVPYSIEEQEQISNTIHSINRIIMLLIEKKSSFNQLKKSLMEKLLTGRIRVV